MRRIEAEEDKLWSGPGPGGSPLRPRTGHGSVGESGDRIDHAADSIFNTTHAIEYRQGQRTISVWAVVLGAGHLIACVYTPSPGIFFLTSFFYCKFDLSIWAKTRAWNPTKNPNTIIHWQGYMK